ncbi:MAG: peroxiredoxin [Beijerinckiaceae bacterium]|nr:peroxiredoxin [Beijerinckiaceae bacterium]
MIKVGDRLPSATFNVMTSEGPKPRTTDEIFSGKKVVLFALPGAFTPTCSNTHVPGYRENYDALKAKGVDAIVMTAVNDVFVMGAWQKDQNCVDKIDFLADGSAKFAKALGLELDLTERGMGVRSKRYSMLVDDGVVKTINIEEGPGADASGAKTMLSQV